MIDTSKVYRNVYIGGGPVFDGSAENIIRCTGEAHFFINPSIPLRPGDIYIEKLSGISDIHAFYPSDLEGEVYEQNLWEQ